ncbi:GntR family transcriptional regulator [Aliiroseovarius subalbicans]|uniref:GntR family transcriptional regulator n=1 Tax=Aliiroseovarius subalbicans TaxID=2925840 RepID=UPI001F578717|nr:GntR family transcriptional regulator [Aliiroseovarius subalbicans]MCI2397775.1 GntR family transcriptional regulator [Aliiroseovarius subalbicans]
MSVIAFLTPDSWLDEGSGPRYRRLQKRIEEGIGTDLLPPNAPLPPEREIAALTGLSRVTVRKAMQALVEQGAIVQKQGSGSFIADIAPRVEQSLSRLTSFTEDMARRGLKSESQWLERGMFMPSPEEVVTLALDPHAPVARIARLRVAGGRPMAIERASLPPDLLPDPTGVTRSLYEVLGRDGNRPERAIQKISAINLDAEDAALLGVPTGAAGLKIERTSYLPGGRVAEFTRSIYRGDAYDFVAELRLSDRQDQT